MTQSALLVWAEARAQYLSLEPSAKWEPATVLAELDALPRNLTSAILWMVWADRAKQGGVTSGQLRAVVPTLADADAVAVSRLNQAVNGYLYGAPSIPQRVVRT